MATPEEFARQYGDIATAAGRQLGVDPAVLLGQWGLETGWGKSIVPGTNNLGNIKDFRGSGVADTDNMTGSFDKYRQFDTPESFADHYTGLIARKYPDALGSGDDAQAYAKALAAGGYAEDPGYVDKISATANTVRRTPGFMDRVAEAIFPAAQAGTLDDEWSALEKQFSGQGVQTDRGDDPWAGLEQQFSRNQSAAPQNDTPQVQTYSDGKGDSVSFPVEPERSFVQGVGDAIRDIPRQVGLTTRYGLEGLGQAAGAFTEPLRQGLNVGLRALDLPEAAPTAQVGASAADALGLPQPQGANERVVGDVTRLMAGAGGIAGGAGALSRGATGAVGSALEGLSMNPGSQVASAAGAGGAGGAVRESGGGELAQAGAGLLGGLVAPMALSGVQSAGRGVMNRVQSSMPSQVDQRIQAALAQSGIDWNQVPERVRQQLRIEAGKALRSGDLDPSAVARLSDFQRIEGATPTRGMLTQDPGQVTREMNLAKQQANSGASGSRNLSQIQADNNTALVRALNQMGAGSADDATNAGQRAIAALQARLGGQKAKINDLYGLAKDSAGRSFPLDHRAFADRAIQSLEDNLAGGALPVDIRNHINRISTGEVPFTVDYAEQLSKLLNRHHKSAGDGSVRYAIGLVRDALNEAPIMPLGQQAAAHGARAVNPGNLPAVAGNAALGEESMAAFRAGRSAHKSMMRQIERTPALKALYEGDIAPEQFVNKYIIGSSARVSDVQRLGRMLAADPPAREAVRTSLTQYLKDKALSGQPDDIGAAKFSPAQYAKALNSLGDRKLGAFFDTDEIAQLHAISRVGRLMVNQPVGSAVNNSNTAAATIGRVLDMMGSAGRGFKLLGVGEQIGAIQSGLGQRSAQRIAPALTAPGAPAQSGRYLIPASVYGGLLAAPSVPGGQDDHRP